MTANLRAKVLGRLEIVGANGPIDISAKKLRGLAGYLIATHPEPQPRDVLMTLLWGSHFEKQARQNLRQALVRLKQLLGAATLAIDDERVGFREPELVSDLARLRHALKEKTGPTLRAIADIEAPELLAGLTIAEKSWTDWIEAERRRVRRQVVDALVLFSDHELREGGNDAALYAAQRAVEFDLTREDAFRLLAQALVALGRGADALARYAEFEARLKEELGAEPSDETRQLIATLQQQPSQAKIAPAAASPAPPDIPEGVSLAVMPFQNISGDDRGAVIAAGLAEDIVTTLAKISHILVVARQSTSGYQGAAPDRQQVSREQGVRHVLEGAVHMAGDRVRVTAHLSDLISGHELWADRFDRQFRDLLDIQDEITKEVVSALQVELTDGEQARIWARGTSSPAAWENIVVATELIHAHHRDGIARARKLAKEAIRLDSGFAAAWAAVGWTHWVEGRWGWAEPKRSFETALDYAQRALTLDPKNPDALGLRGVCALHVGAFDEAVRTMEEALLNAPGHAHFTALTGYVHRYYGNTERAVACMRRAMRLSPVHPPWYAVPLGVSLWHLGQTEEALAYIRDAAGRDPEFTSTLAFLAAYLAVSGHLSEASSVVGDLLDLEPSFSAGEWNRHNPYRDDVEREFVLSGLLKAGAPA